MTYPHMHWEHFASRVREAARHADPAAGAVLIVLAREADQVAKTIKETKISER